jgi:hypothetical protein
MSNLPQAYKEVIVLTVLWRRVDEATLNGESLGSIVLPVAVLEWPNGAERLRCQLENLLYARGRE